MKIETKFAPGDKVYFLHDSSVVKETVKKVMVEVYGETYPGGPLVMYNLGANIAGSTYEYHKYESELASSVEELIKASAVRIQ